MTGQRAQGVHLLVAGGAVCGRARRGRTVQLGAEPQSQLVDPRFDPGPHQGQAEPVGRGDRLVGRANQSERSQIGRLPKGAIEEIAGWFVSTTTV